METIKIIFEPFKRKYLFPIYGYKVQIMVMKFESASFEKNDINKRKYDSHKIAMHQFVVNW